MPMKSIQEALDSMMPAFEPTGTQRLGLGETLGFSLAEDVVTRRDLPPFDNSAMDGYALRTTDVRGASRAAPCELRLSSESRAGGPTPPPLSPGAVMRIFTGAQVPEGADAVVPQEDVEVRGKTVVFHRAPEVGEWVRRRASDTAQGRVLLAQGSWLGPGELGLCAAQGIAVVSVHRQPRVAIISTGDELRDIHDTLSPGTIVNSNAYALSAQVRLAGGQPVVLPIVPDELEATVRALEQGLDCDLVLTCGGVSVGDYDLVKQAFATVGIQADFWKVDIKPGKPITFGRKGGVPVVGLPGNPVSAMVAFEVLVRPGLRKMAGDPRPYRLRHLVTLAVEHRHEKGRVELVRARVAMQEGRLWATPLELQGSGSLPSVVGADAFVVLDGQREVFVPGEALPAILLRDEVGSEVSPFANGTIGDVAGDPRSPGPGQRAGSASEAP